MSNEKVRLPAPTTCGRNSKEIRNQSENIDGTSHEHAPNATTER